MAALDGDFKIEFAKLFKAKVEELLPELSKTRGIGLVNIFGNVYHELSHSNVIYSLLQPKVLDVSESIGDSLLEIISDSCGNSELKEEHVILVEKEKKTNYGRSIDIFITTDHFNIILENKIYAGDQENQIKDYLEFVESTSKDKTAIVVYLTPSGYDPSTYSISKKTLVKLKQENRFAALSYENDITKWLGSIKAEGILQQEIEIYKNLIEEEVCQMSNGGYAFFKANYEELRTMVSQNPDSIQDCIRGLELIALTAKNLDKLNSLFSLLSENYDSVRFISEQSYLFSDFSEFEDYIVKNDRTTYYGICVDIANDIRIGLEYNSKGKWYFGFMKGLDGTPAAITNKQNVDLLELTPDWEDEGYKIYPKSDWWGECADTNDLMQTQSVTDISSWFENQIEFTNASLIINGTISKS